MPDICRYALPREICDINLTSKAVEAWSFRNLSRWGSWAQTPTRTSEFFEIRMWYGNELTSQSYCRYTLENSSAVKSWCGCDWTVILHAGIPKIYTCRATRHQNNSSNVHAIAHALNNSENVLRMKMSLHSKWLRSIFYRTLHLRSAHELNFVVHWRWAVPR